MNISPDCDDMGIAKEHKLQEEIDRENRDSAINRAMAEVAGWELIGRPDQYDPPVGVAPGKQVVKHNVKPIPNFLKDTNAIFAAYRHVGVTDPKNFDLRVKWVANLRLVVGRRCPKNKVGAPLISDIDLLMADDPVEHCEALLRTMKKWDTKWGIL